MCFLTWCTLAYPALAIGTTDNCWWVPAFMGMIVVVGLVVWVRGQVRRRTAQGIDIDLVYKELPPE